MEKFNTVVVGGGMAGLTASAYVSRSGRSVALLEKESYVGGLVNSFRRGGFLFDGGMRSVESSGIVFPMLRDLGIDIEFGKSSVSIVLGNDVLRLEGSDSIGDYSRFLKKHFPDNREDIDSIIGEIRKITGYMDILYGIDNPLFLDIRRDWKYFTKVVFPWLFKFAATVGKIQKLSMPVKEYLENFTGNRELIDNITQHFFNKTPASFALSYFSLYNDYNYPVGGTKNASLIHGEILF